MSDKLKKRDADEILDILRDMNSTNSMNDGAISLWFDKHKSKNLAEINRNMADSYNSRISSIQTFLNICFQIATFDARVNYELESFLHSMAMNALTRKERAIEVRKKVIENKMLETEVDLAMLDASLKRTALQKINSRYEEEEEPNYDDSDLDPDSHYY